MQESKRKDPIWSIWVAITVASLLVLAYVVRFAVVIDAPLAKDPAAWGSFGDYIGGIINPLIAFMALLWLVESVRLQRQELAATRDELAKAAEAQREQVLLAAKTAKISAISTMLQSVQSEIEQSEAYMSRLAMVKAGADQVGGPHGKALSLTEAHVETVRVGVRLEQLRKWREDHRESLDRESAELSRRLTAEDDDALRPEVR